MSILMPMPCMRGVRSLDLSEERAPTNDAEQSARAPDWL